MIICNSSPLIALAIIDCLFILNHLKQNLYIPSAVYQEVTKKDKPYSAQLKTFLKEKMKEVQNVEAVKDLMIYLDKGEVEVIQLAIEKKADFIIIDDKKGRNIASLKGLNVAGTAGLLLAAKKKNLVKAVVPLIKKLQKHDIYFSKDLLMKISEISGEKSTL